MFFPQAWDKSVTKKQSQQSGDFLVMSPKVFACITDNPVISEFSFLNIWQKPEPANRVSFDKRR